MPIPDTPYTRKEAYLNAAATGDSSGIPETPYTREEMYLDAIAKNGGGGGGGGGSSTLSGLTDVDISNPTDGQTLVYNATSGKWENGAGGEGGGYKLFEVTLMAVENSYDFLYPGIAIAPGDITVSYFQGTVYVERPFTLKLVSFSDSLFMSLNNFDISESYMPVCTGGVEVDLVSGGFIVSGDGTITCKGQNLN